MVVTWVKKSIFLNCTEIKCFSIFGNNDNDSWWTREWQTASSMRGICCATELCRLNWKDSTCRAVESITGTRVRRHKCKGRMNEWRWRQWNMIYGILRAPTHETYATIYIYLSPLLVPRIMWHTSFDRNPSEMATACQNGVTDWLARWLTDWLKLPLLSIPVCA